MEGAARLNRSAAHPRVLMIYWGFDASACLCGYLQCSRLAEQGEISFRHKRAVEVRQEDLVWADTVVFVRGHTALEAWIAKRCHAAGKYLLYILDDDLLHVPEYLGSASYYALPSVRRHVRDVMQACDGLVSPSRRLLSQYGDGFSKTFQISEPAVGLLRTPKGWPDGRVRIGFAGSLDRGRDIDAILSEALRQITKTYQERVVIEFFGVETSIARELGCRTYPYLASYEEYQRQMDQLNWDIGLAPMPESPFHACKHYNKLVEYSGHGIAGIYSSVPPYTDAVRDGETGLLCENTTEAWIAAISRLIEDRRLRESISAACLTQAGSDFSVEKSAADFGSALYTLPDRAEDCGPHYAGILKYLGIGSWFLEKVWCRIRKVGGETVKKEDEQP